jgi:hypothetical protein
MRQLSGAPWQQSVRDLYLVAMVLFAVSVIIGILNGAGLVDFGRSALLTHVHAGTLGWITLGLVASAFWLFGRASALLAWVLAGLVTLYVAAFYAGSFPALAVTGVGLLGVIGWLLVWVWRAWLADRSLPGLALALALTTFGYGSVIGVLLQVQAATETRLFPAGADVVGAHAGTMVFSYLILAAMGLIEWRLRGMTRISAAGAIQVLGLFVGGLLIVVTNLFLPDALQQIAGIYLLVTLVAIGIFVARIVIRVVRVNWTAADQARYLATAALFVLAALGIFLVVVGLVIANPDEPLPAHILIASDHATFVGVITNLLFALMLAVTVSRRRLAAWSDQFVYWGMNAGLLVFVIGLIAQATLLVRIGAPVMGAAILLGLAVMAARLRGADLEAGTVGEPAPA